MIARGKMGKASKGAAFASLLLLAACAAPSGSMSSKGDVFDAPQDLCTIEPTKDIIDALKTRSDYADLLVFLGRACPERADLFGIGATASLPSLGMMQEDGGRGIVVNSIRSPAGDGRDVTPPSPPVDDGTPVVVTDPPPEAPGPVVMGPDAT